MLIVAAAFCVGTGRYKSEWKREPVKMAAPGTRDKWTGDTELRKGPRGQQSFGVQWMETTRRICPPDVPRRYDMNRLLLRVAQVKYFLLPNL